MITPVVPSSKLASPKANWMTGDELYSEKGPSQSNLAAQAERANCVGQY